MVCRPWFWVRDHSATCTMIPQTSPTMCSFESHGWPCDTVSMLSIRVRNSNHRCNSTDIASAPHYHPSELVLGSALKALRKEFPRESYQILTKTGKFSPSRKDHDLSENMTRLCVERSLKRFDTDYLDVVCTSIELMTDFGLSCCRSARCGIQFFAQPSCRQPCPCSFGPQTREGVRLGTGR